MALPCAASDAALNTNVYIVACGNKMNTVAADKAVAADENSINGNERVSAEIVEG